MEHTPVNLTYMRIWTFIKFWIERYLVGKCPGSYGMVYTRTTTV